MVIKGKEADWSGGYSEVYLENRKKEFERGLLVQALKLTTLFAPFFAGTPGQSKYDHFEAYKKRFPVTIDLPEEEIARREKEGFAPYFVDPSLSFHEQLAVLKGESFIPSSNLGAKDRENSEPRIVWMKLVEENTLSSKEEIREATVLEGLAFYIATGGGPFEVSPIFFLNPADAINGQFPIATKAERLTFIDANLNLLKNRSFKHLVVLK